MSFFNYFYYALTDLQCILNMGGRKLHFDQRKDRQKHRQEQSDVVSLPVSSALTLESLYSCLVTETLPGSWNVAAKNPIILVKLRVHQTSRVDVVITLVVNENLTWTLSVFNIRLDPASNPSLGSIASTIIAASDVLNIVQVVDSLRCCAGNGDARFLDLFKHRSTTLHGSSGI